MSQCSKLGIKFMNMKQSLILFIKLKNLSATTKKCAKTKKLAYNRVVLSIRINACFPSNGKKKKQKSDALHIHLKQHITYILKITK